MFLKKFSHLVPQDRILTKAEWIVKCSIAIHKIMLYFEALSFFVVIKS